MAYPINPPAMSFMARKLVRDAVLHAMKAAATDVDTPISRARRTDMKNYTATYEPKTMAGERGWSWRLFADRRLVAEGWSRGRKREAEAEVLRWQRRHWRHERVRRLTKAAPVHEAVL